MSISRSVPVESWGKDHWSTLAYVETLAVDGQQSIDLRRMRVDNSRHPLLAHHVSDMKYPTCLHGGVELYDQDDWDCLADAVGAGFIKILGLPRNYLDVEPGRRGMILPSLPRKALSTGGFMWTGKPKVKFTPLGITVVASLRAHKASGGTFSTFVWRREEG